ncbi:MAG TPA: HesA/MoeB/ThiF family protein [Syntrophomonadaceae bacterium]|nr:HesA/MoeB/ThiF family protein [Syntrophomonadaceae bacterium]
MPKLTETQKQRYLRQIIMEDIGEEGQIKLADSRVLVVGTGGLGSPILLYLSAAGVGTIGIVDHDLLEMSNLNRQIIHNSDGLGTPKAYSAAKAISKLNPDVKTRTIYEMIDEENVDDIIRDYDVVVNAVDNLETRYVVNDACLRARKPLIEGGVMGFNGMAMTVLPGNGPCFRCVFPNQVNKPKTGPKKPIGVLGAVPGIIGSIQALETIKVLLGKGEVLNGRVLMLDGLEMNFREVSVKQNPNCLCSKEI